MWYLPSSWQPLWYMVWLSTMLPLTPEASVGKIAKILAFTVMRPDDRPQFITYAISICICCIMCPIMSFAATLLFKENKTFGTWGQTWGMNFPMALLYQMFYCGPLVRLIFRTIFHEKKQER